MEILKLNINYYLLFIVFSKPYKNIISPEHTIIIPKFYLVPTCPIQARPRFSHIESLKKARVIDRVIIAKRFNCLCIGSNYF